MPPVPPGGTRSAIDPNRLEAAAYGRDDTRYDPRFYAVTTQDMRQFEAVFSPNGGIFAPGYPLAPTQPAPVRGFDFPQSVNTQLKPRSVEPISFEQLRALADNHDVTRLAIETRKDQVEKLEWTIRQRDAKNTPGKDVENRIAEATDFFQAPDRVQPFAEWVRGALEDLMVLDAPAFEVRRNRGGKLIGLDPVDGSTIKVLVDDYGRRPAAPAPAYMQVIHGRPWRLLTSDELLYRPRNRRVHKLYGFSPVEQIIMTVNIGLRRQLMQLQHFTEGNVPKGMASAPEGWTTDQIERYQEWFDAKFTGNQAERTRIFIGPPGAKYEAFKESPFKDEFDEWLARIVCYAFSLPPNAFVKQQNRATAESAHSVALEEGLQPLMGWIKRLADHVLTSLMGWPDLEFAWADVKSVDPLEQAQVLDIYTKAGIYTLDEARDFIGEEPYENGLGKTPLIVAGATVMRVEDAIQEPPEPPDPIALAEAQARAKIAGQPPGAEDGKGEGEAGKPPAEGDEKALEQKPGSEPPKPAKKADLDLEGLAARLSKAAAGYEAPAPAPAPTAAPPMARVPFAEFARIERRLRRVEDRPPAPAPLPAEPAQPLHLTVNVDARRPENTRRRGVVKRQPDGSLSLEQEEVSEAED